MFCDAPVTKLELAGKPGINHFASNILSKIIMTVNNVYHGYIEGEIFSHPIISLIFSESSQLQRLTS